MENVFRNFKGKHFDNLEFPRVKVKVGELLYNFQCEVRENNSSHQVLLRTSEIVDEIGDSRKFLDEKFAKVRFFESSTEFFFDSLETLLPEISEIEWNRFIEQVIISLIRIQINNSSENSSPLKRISWIPEKVENLDIRTASVLIFNIFSYSYTFPVEFKYLRKEQYEQDKRILVGLKRNRKTEVLFCLSDVEFEDKLNKISIQEPIESNDVTKTIEGLDEWLNEIRLEKITDDFGFKVDLSRFFKVSVEGFAYFSSSVLKQSQMFFSDVLSEGLDWNNNQFFKMIQTKLDSFNRISFSDLTFVEKIQKKLEYCIPISFSHENIQRVLYNYNRFRGLRHKNLVKVIGMQESTENFKLVTETKIKKISFEDQIKPMTDKKKLKILKELTRLVDFCQSRGYFFIGLDPNNLYLDTDKNIIKVGLCYFERLSDYSLVSNEEKLGLVARNTENFRLGLMIKKMFLEKDEEVTCNRQLWLIESIPNFTEDVLRENSFMCQLVTELTNVDPNRRLECKKLLEILENR